MEDIEYRHIALSESLVLKLYQELPCEEVCNLLLFVPAAPPPAFVQK